MLEQTFATKSKSAAARMRGGDFSLSKVVPDHTDDQALNWFDCGNLRVLGQGWEELNGGYGRLPERCKKHLPDAVWKFGMQSSGISVHFCTDSPEVFVHWKTKFLTSSNHIADTAVSGLDLYARAEDHWLWLATARPSREAESTNQLVRSAPPGVSEYLLYLPLFSAVRNIAVGLHRDACMYRPNASNVSTASRKVCFYGTSATQGASASRPGMTYPSILGRWLNFEPVNLGFSGNGRMDFAMAEYLAEIDCLAYVIDCASNMSPQLMRSRGVPFVGDLHARRPNTPIVLVEFPCYPAAWFESSLLSRYTSRIQALRAVALRCPLEVLKQLHYAPADPTGGIDAEASVANHPTDLGFMRIASMIAPVLRPIVEKETS